MAADIDIDIENGAAKICRNCGSRISTKRLNSKVAFLRDLTNEDFYLCSDCITIVNNQCSQCGGAVYVPTSRDNLPEICPACRNKAIEETGSDPGWKNTATD